MTTPGGTHGQARRPWTARLAVAGLLAWPLAEIVVAVLVGRWLGGPLTVVLLVLLSLLGGVVLRRTGPRALRSLSTAAAPGVRVMSPDLRGAGDAGWVLLGGVLLAVPGFLTAAAGALLVIGPTRRLLAPALGRGAGRLASRALGVPLVGRMAGTRVVAGDVVVEATVVDDVATPPSARARPAPRLGPAGTQSPAGAESPADHPEDPGPDPRTGR